MNPPGHMIVQKLFKDRMTCLVARDHPAVRTDLLTLDEYVALKHMLISRTGTRIGLIDAWLAAKALERRIALIVPHFLSAPFIVARTDMLLSLPERIAQKFMDLAPLSILSAPIDLPAYELVMVWHPLREKDSVHRWLPQAVDLLLDAGCLCLGHVVVPPVGVVQRCQVARDAGLHLLKALGDLGHREVLVAGVDA